MDGYLGEIRLFAGTFPPRNWAFCNGQNLSVYNFNSIFAVIGSRYGGDGQSYFCLPNFCGKTAIGFSEKSNFTPYSLGVHGGKETEVLTVNNLPAHSHDVQIEQPGYSTECRLKCSEVQETDSPSGTYFGKSDGDFYGEMGEVVMNTCEIDLGNINPGSVNLLSSGNGSPHNNMMPFLVLSFIICIKGNYPIGE